MSLHEQLLADLDDLDDDEELVEDDDEEVPEVKDAMDLEIEELKSQSVHAIAKLAESTQLKRIMEQIEHFRAQPDRAMIIPIEQDDEYKLIVESNNLTVEIDNEINVIHKFCRDHYAKRFPELEQLVKDPIDYARSVKTLHNDLNVDLSEIHDILPPATVMVVSVTASTTQGETLTSEELERVSESAELMLKLSDAKQTILDYVQGKMHILAPNLTHICGASTAAKLLGTAGGLTAVSKMPACNILVLGSQKNTASGFSAANTLPHTGYIYYSDVVQSYPPDSRKRCARMVAGKLALAARVDAHQNSSSSNADTGIKLREDIDKKMDKYLEPPPAKVVKALPRPDDAPRKKRGGKRFRRQKEKYQMTEARKAANRMTFGELAEDEFQDEAQGQKIVRVAGKVRAIEMTQKGGQISKRMQKRLAKQRTNGGMTTIANAAAGGTASVTFTPMQGLEIVTPHLNEETKKSKGKYFGDGLAFSKPK